MIKVGIGQDSHRFDFDDKNKKLILGGFTIPGEPPLQGNSDADVILHSITNAISGVTGVNILGKISDELCLEKGILDSSVYIKEAMKYLNDLKIIHLSISVECKRPKLAPYIEKIKETISEIIDIDKNSIGLTATTGEGLTGFGKGQGIQAISIITVN
jgi:2-C-methyl-D-erythritol 2,4-cyclodiphosphate synthase